MSIKSGRARKPRQAAKQPPSAGSAHPKSPAPLDTPSGGSFGLPALAIVIAALFAYLPTLSAKFIWDDDVHFVLNPNMMSWSGLGRIWTEDVFYYPLTSTSFWLLRRVIELRAPAYHLLNVLVHATNAVLLWRVLKGLGARGAWLAGLLFAIHPVNAQSVAWITELKNTQSGFFYLLSAWAFVQHERGGSNRALAAALALFPLALLSKTSTVTLPFALLLIHLWMRKPLDRRAILTLAPFFALSALAGILTILFHRHHVAGPDWNETPIQRVAIASRALWFYLLKLLWPVNLAFVYTRWSPAAAIGWLAVVGALAALVTLCLKGNSSGRAVKFAAAYFALSLLPVLNFFRMYYTLYSYAADHWQYLAAMGPLAVAAAGLAQVSDRLRRVGMPEWTPWAPAAAITISLSVLTLHQTRAYQSLTTLWQDTLRKNPECWLAWNGLGQVHEMAGRTHEAISAFENAARLQPDNVKLLNNLAGNLITVGRAADAAPYLDQAIKADPKDAVAYFNFGRISLDRKDNAGAADWFQKAIERRPNYPVAYLNLGVALTELGDLKQAELALRKALELEPKRPQTRIQLGMVLKRTGRAEEARRILLEGDLNPAGLGL